MGYRALNQKLRTEHDIKVPRHLVHNVLADLDPAGLDARRLQNKGKKRKYHFRPVDPYGLCHLTDMINSADIKIQPFPYAFAAVWTRFRERSCTSFVCYTNSDPRMIGKKYLEYLCREKMMPSFLRIDKGTDTGKMATVHVYLINKFEVMDDPVEAVIYGPSTSNEIERWWRDLHERLENYFKIQLTQLLRDRQYDPHNILDRQLLAYVYIPIIQRECDIFVIELLEISQNQTPGRSVTSYRSPKPYVCLSRELWRT